MQDQARQNRASQSGQWYPNPASGRRQISKKKTAPGLPGRAPLLSAAEWRTLLRDSTKTDFHHTDSSRRAKPSFLRRTILSAIHARKKMPNSIETTQ